MTETSPTFNLDTLASSPLDRLMPYKVRRVLLVASLYDSFILEEDGRLHDLLGQAYKQRDLGYVPTLSRVTGGAAALQALEREAFDLVVCVQRLGDMDPFTFGKKAKGIHPGLPVVILAFNTPELARLQELNDFTAIDKVFVWQGDGKILAGIVQFVEDLKNAESDTHLFGVPNLLIVEDSVRFYSTYLPVIFEELWDQTEKLLEDDLGYSQKALRQRGRPRVHLAETYEQAVAVFEKYQDNLLGVFTDVRYPRNGKLDPRAGVEFAKLVRAELPHLPLLIQSSEENTEQIAKDLDAEFLLKSSPTLVDEFRHVLVEHFGFGDLVLRDKSGDEVARIKNLDSFLSVIDSLPAGALRHHFQSGDIRRWLLLRTEFDLARVLAQPDIAAIQDDAGLRSRIKQEMQARRQQRHRGSILNYSRRFDASQWHFARLGGGSIGGKARGLAFIDKVLASHFDHSKYEGVTVSIPRTLVLGTDLFDEFVRHNDLFKKAMAEDSDARIVNLFLNASLPPTVVGDVRDFIKQVKRPLAVRSSSLLEDALYQPFAGIYYTKMVPNNQFDLDARFLGLDNAIKLVWASTFLKQARSYIESTNHRCDEEKMAVIVQEVVGAEHNGRWYPDFAGVARSYNYYPVGHAKPEDGVVNAALGLGKTVVDGGVSLRFTPAYPEVLPQFYSVKEMLANSQKAFYAIDMSPHASTAFAEEDQYLVSLPLEQAERDGTLEHVGSVYDHGNQRLVDGINEPGPRVVSFAHILKYNMFPMAELLDHLLKLASLAMSCPVEMEFAVRLDPKNIMPADFGFLQVRPLVVSDELVKVDLAAGAQGDALCFSDQVLGNGVSGFSDIIYVKPKSFDAAQTPQIANEVGELNKKLKEQDRNYILIGPGRWGSSDPWLGIPVKFDQISKVKVVVEACLPTMNVDPSQGSHFFQNMTSLRIGYFTVPTDEQRGRIDWDWLDARPAAAETEHLRWIALDKPLQVQIDGRSSHGVILKL
ncbi:MAG TPA: PEP/pyruvate-binding domain-containing protein [Candidatus Edwardsbacteria bacterium]|nr:PEP/pyruvate-binding domain-containing protein [Candidatus Edwardsbacteria bacterium]